MSDIVLSSGVRSNLLQLQQTSELITSTQTKLATGKRVNSALDNPINYFTAQGLTVRANDLNALLDTMSTGINTIQAANNGISSITKLVQSAQSLVSQANQTTDTTVRATLAAQYDSLRTQIDQLSGDSGIPQVQAASRTLDTLLSPEWTLLPRTPTTDDVRDQMRKVGARDWKSPVVMVRTMYETGEMILKLASALNIITLVAVLVLLLVVLTGVVNSLRMTVRERTREIGTLRSLGMQASQVRVLFLMETGLLALFSAVAGTLAAGAIMFGLSSITFGIQGNPLSILMVRGHLVFAPGIVSTIGQILLVVGMAVIAAWGPSATAARSNPADALRHHE